MHNLCSMANKKERKKTSFKLSSLGAVQEKNSQLKFYSTWTPKSQISVNSYKFLQTHRQLQNILIVISLSDHKSQQGMCALLMFLIDPFAQRNPAFSPLTFFFYGLYLLLPQSDILSLFSSLSLFFFPSSSSSLHSFFSFQWSSCLYLLFLTFLIIFSCSLPTIFFITFTTFGPLFLTVFSIFLSLIYILKGNAFLFYLDQWYIIYNLQKILLL